LKFCLITQEEDLENVLSKDIDPKQLEEKYNGARPNLESYWPPTTSTDRKRAVSDQDILRKGLIPFVFNSKLYKAYKKEIKLSLFSDNILVV
jgi:hypothetical protein